MQAAAVWPDIASQRRERAGGRLDQITLVPARTNMQPAVAAYLRGPGGRRATAYGIMVLAIDGSIIGEITRFTDPALFPFFGLPGHLEP
jgi:RNA polymerase sigma-70 factor (ECF subfamily)